MEFVFNTREEFKKHVKQWGNEPRNYKILEDQNREQEPKPQQTTTQYYNIQDPPTQPTKTQYYKIQEPPEDTTPILDDSDGGDQQEPDNIF